MATKSTRRATRKSAKPAKAATAPGRHAKRPVPNLCSDLQRRIAFGLLADTLHVLAAKRPAATRLQRLDKTARQAASARNQKKYSPDARRDMDRFLAESSDEVKRLAKHAHGAERKVMEAVLRAVQVR